MKQLLLILAVVALVGCWKKEAPKGEIRVRVQRSTPYQELPKATVGKLIANPIVEKAIRKSLKKPTGELTEADLEKVKELYLGVNKLTDVKGLEKFTQLKTLVLNNNQLTEVKGLEKLTRLEVLHLENNPDLTKAQIDQLQKALPKCHIYSNPKK